MWTEPGYFALGWFVLSASWTYVSPLLLFFIPKRLVHVMWVSGSGLQISCIRKNPAIHSPPKPVPSSMYCPEYGERMRTVPAG